MDEKKFLREEFEQLGVNVDEILPKKKDESIDEPDKPDAKDVSLSDDETTDDSEKKKVSERIRDKLKEKLELIRRRKQEQMHEREESSDRNKHQMYSLLEIRKELSELKYEVRKLRSYLDGYRNVNKPTKPMDEIDGSSERDYERMRRIYEMKREKYRKYRMLLEKNKDTGVNTDSVSVVKKRLLDECRKLIVDKTMSESKLSEVKEIYRKLLTDRDNVSLSDLFKYRKTIRDIGSR